MSHRLICGDVLEVLPTLGHFKCLIADPPDNIGRKYDEYDDTRPDDEYRVLLQRWLELFMHKADIVWVSFNARWLFTVGYIVEDWRRRWLYQEFEPRLFIQNVTFGENQRHDCGNGYRPILRIKHRDAAIYPDAIKVPSARQTKYKDKRAKEGGRVPLDVWEFPRVCGTFKQKRKWHDNQLHEGLIERMIKFSTLPGESICDVFSGTGTVLRAINNLKNDNWTHVPEHGIPCTYVGQHRNPVTSIELSTGYCEKIAAEHGLSWDFANSKRWNQWAA